MHFPLNTNKHTHTHTDAAQREGIDPKDLIIEKVSVLPGGCGIHDGRCWHGSGGNKSKTRPRRGIGIHFVPACVKWKSNVGPLWRRLKAQQQEEGIVSNKLFPVTFTSTPTTNTRLIIVTCGIFISGILSFLKR